MLTSKDILERTGISRATLNNYIAAGLVARPEVLPPAPEHGDAPRIGYFPDETVERIETIQRLKGQGWSLARILQSFQGTSTPARSETPDLPFEPLPAPARHAPSPSSPQSLVIAVLAVTLHDADSLWVALSVHDYFALTNDISGEVRRIVKAWRGEASRVAPHRFVCRFLPRPGALHLHDALEAAEAVRDAVREASGRWKLQRGWELDVEAAAGVCEGESWVAASPGDDVQIVGETLDDAQELARCARAGTVLATRSIIARLPQDLRGAVTYGVPAAHQHGGPPARPMTFARLEHFAPPGTALSHRLAALPVTEIVRLHGTAAPLDPEDTP